MQVESYLKTFFPPSQHKLKLITVLGAGLLCGTALSIIIPEGVELVQESWKGKTGHLPLFYSLLYQGIDMQSHAHSFSLFTFMKVI